MRSHACTFAVHLLGGGVIQHLVLFILYPSLKHPDYYYCSLYPSIPLPMFREKSKGSKGLYTEENSMLSV
jgi:hypothetical protein